MSTTNNPNPSIDERIHALTMNLELLLKHGEDLAAENQRRKEESDRHEREIQRFRRALRGALEAWADEPEA